MSLIPTIVNWYGGKNKLARQIISMMPPHEHYVEVFMGGASVFFQKPKSPRNTLNDFNGNLVNLFVQVRDNYEALAKKCEWTLYSREEYNKFYRLYQNKFKDIDDTTRAMMYLFLIRASFNSQIETDFSASIESNSASFNLSMLERIKLARNKLDGCVIENRSFEEILEKYGSLDNSFLYLDPPYWVTMQESNYYEHAFSKLQHIGLFLHLKKCTAPWILSYDDVPEIVELYKDFTILRLSVTYSLGLKKRTRKLDELIITNLEKIKLPQLNMFDEEVERNEVGDEEKVEAVNLIQIAESGEKKIVSINNRRKSDPDQTSLF
jgi:DNA adenine methylase